MINLIDNWRIIWWRRWSTWLAALNALFVSYQVLVLGIIGFAPDGWRWPLAVLSGVIAFGVPVLTALIKQPKLEAKLQEKTDGPA